MKKHQVKDALPSEKTQSAHRRAIKKMAFMVYNVNGNSHKTGSIVGYLKSGVLNLRMSIMTVVGLYFLICCLIYKTYGNHTFAHNH